MRNSNSSLLNKKSPMMLHKKSIERHTPVRVNFLFLLTIIFFLKKFQFFNKIIKIIKV